MHALIVNNAVARYPYTRTDLRADNPNTSFPAEIGDPELEEWDVMRVFPTTAPSADQATQKVVEQSPLFNASTQQWEQDWQVVALTAAELQSTDQALYDGIVTATQARLDTFSQGRGYDNILSACTYATSSVAKFATEGQYCVDARDATWSALLTMLAEVQAGTRTKPAGYADIEPELPALVWP